MKIILYADDYKTNDYNGNKLTHETIQSISRWLQLNGLNLDINEVNIAFL